MKDNIKTTTKNNLVEVYLVEIHDFLPSWPEASLKVAATAGLMDEFHEKNTGPQQHQ